jgi:uncharacterized protein (DUF302 family)
MPLETLAYGMQVRVKMEFAEAVAAIREALRAQGFGVLTEIDVQKVMREKLGVETPAYVILGACNPPLVRRALEAEPEIGLLLPCNVTVRQDGEQVLVAAMDPVTAMGAVVHNPTLGDVAQQAKAKLAAALEAVEAQSVR